MIEQHKRPQRSIQSAEDLTDRSTTAEVRKLSGESPFAPNEALNRTGNVDHDIGFDRDGHDRPSRTDDHVSEDADGSIAPESGRPSSSRFGRRRNLLLAILLLVGAAIAVPAWNYLSSYEDTDDAQVDGHIILVSSRINGTIVHVYVIDTQAVWKGQLLADIDPADYVVAVENARARLAQTKAQVESAKADYQTALDKVRQDEATRAKAEYDVPRLEILAAKGAGRREDYQESLRVARVARATVDADRAGANAALKNIASREAAVKEAQAGVDQALLNYSYTSIAAPMSGVIGKKSVEPGQRVQPGESLLAVVPLDDVWVTANFKEDQLRRMRPGQPVDIHVDALGHTFKGYVDGLGSASGERFSLLPPENATGNFVKVVQRIPVRIDLEPGQNIDHRLVPGMSVEPTVWLK
jgi:membrane fusion protein (multidrug efflux system)